ncbi:MAG TPA: hypothetical protein VK886_12625 [Vicinamibacterales bacterium]|nr:hypothetical protein [Vicinamibacterales bacterium]
MGRIDMKRVVLGGLLAGLIINIGEFVLNMMVFEEQMTALMARLNLPPVGGNAIAVFVVLGFVLGIASVWLYAAIRPRFGAGPRTALTAAVAAWLLAYLYPTVGAVVMGLFPAQMSAIALIWGLVEVVVATVAGAYVYQEPAAAGRATARV